MNIFSKVANNLPLRSSSFEHFDDDAFFQQAYEEIENGQMDKGLWARLFAQFGGDENKAKAQYIKTRVQQLVTRQTNLDTENKKKQEQKWEKQEQERKQEQEKEINIKRIEEAKGYISLPVGGGLCEAMGASSETEFNFKCGVPDNEAARYLLLALRIENLKELDVGGRVIKVGDMKIPAYFM